jgi:predicted secreted protein with PEFG-CTERM motif
MRRSSILIGIIVITIAFSITAITPISAQVAGPANPNANVTTAYKLLHQNGTISASTLPPLSIKTDLPVYSQGDSIIMTGHVRDIVNGTDVTLRVFNSLPNLITVAQIRPSADGSFTKTFLATGPLWKDAGNYTLVAQYGRYTQANSTFIPYIIKGATVKSMDIFASKYTLEITLSPATTDGSITITLPRQVIDAKVPPPPNPDANLTGSTVNTAELEDDKFIVVVGDKVVTFTETKNQSVRILSIPFHAGDTKVDVVGTVIVPEFGPIAALVLAIAIISIIAVSAKTGLRFIPKY